MRNLKFGAATAAILATAFLAAPAGAETTVLSNLTVIDGTGAPAKPNSAIVMTDGKIAWVGPVAQLKAPKDAKVEDMSGKFVMPGIIDGHVHVGMMHDVTQDEKHETPENVQADLKQYAAYGVTTVQVLGTDKDFVLKMRDEQRKSRPTMARIFSAGQGVVIKGGYGGLVGVTTPISTPEEARKVMDAMTDHNLRVLFALCRFGGLRVRSEAMGLKWGDINWETRRMLVRSPKTERHRGHEARVVPIAPSLMTELQDAFDKAKSGAERVVDLHWTGSVFNRTNAAVYSSGVTPWPALFQTLRSSCEIEWAMAFPQFAVSRWIGHSIAISGKHYANMVPDELYDAAAERATTART